MADPIQVLKIPPPYGLAADDQMFNRWLLELTGILAKQGGIDADAINGTQASVAELQTQIEALQRTINLLQQSTSIVNGRLTSGTVAPVPTQGNNGDWYASTVTGKGVYVKNAAGTWVLVAS